MKLEEKFSVLDELVNFRELCLKNNKKHNSEVFDQELFFGILTKLNRKYPLLFFPEFVEDFFSGYFTKKLTRKHHIDSGIELWNIVENTLKINPSREKSLKNNSLEKNLRYPKNKIFYEKFLTFTKDFSKEIFKNFLFFISI